MPQLLDLKAYASEGISLDFRLTEAGTPTIGMAGCVEHPNPSVFMDPLFRDLDAMMRRAGSGLLRIDLSGLAFMNSSGIKSMIRYVMRLAEAADYRLELVYAPDVTWQHPTMRAIAVLARGCATVTVRE